MSFRNQSSQTRFEFVLARDLGKTRAEMMANMSEPEIILWRVFYEVEAEEADRAAKESKKAF
jgi:hypothetical protein